MSLNRLLVQNLRNLETVDIAPAGRVNWLYGENGSGKTSVLEAVSLLAQGRSFRTHKFRTLINHQSQSMTLFGRVVPGEGEAPIPLGLTRSADGSAQFKARGELVSSAAELAQYLPVQIINADSFRLLEAGPKVRRQFIDWLVFHVEPGFFPAWKALRRCLKHRNSLLRRDRITARDLEPWDKELVTQTRIIHDYRREQLERFLSHLNELITDFVALEDLGVSYYRGWDADSDYAEVLERGFAGDRQQGYTHMGSHRADLKLRIGRHPAVELLSRGQQKLLVCALKIAQASVFNHCTGRRCVFLVDDLPSELDAAHQRILVDWLECLQTQVFVTGVEAESLTRAWSHTGDKDATLFHVEHGSVTRQT